MMIDLSVIISTCNRSESLKDTLNSLLVQEGIESLNYEIVIINNNSKDKTKDVIESYFPKFNGKLRYLFEHVQGKSVALNLAIKETGGEILAFTDDDCIVDKTWLANIYECFKKHDCEGMGGRILPLYPDNVPRWVKENRDILSGPIVNYDFGKNLQVYEDNNFNPFVGANMAFRKNCFNKYGLFRTDLGPGRKAWGDDTEFFMRLEAHSVNLYYYGLALVWHKVDKERVCYKYLAKWYLAIGRFMAKENRKKEDMHYCFGIPRYLLRGLAEHTIMLIFKAFNTREFLEHWKRIFIHIGQILEYKKLKICQK